MTDQNREAWLTAAVDALRPLLAEAGAVVPERVRVSVGWPGGPGKKNSVIGQCWPTKTSADSVPQLFISPVVTDTVRVLDVLTHELIHAADDCESGHRGAFARSARKVGLVGAMTATTAGPELAVKLAEIQQRLGDYPHAALVNLGSRPKQTTRMLKVECAEGSGYKLRMTRQWLDDLGAPLCPCHETVMAEAD